MRILVLHNYYQHSGGEDTVVQQEYNELSKQGHEVKIISEKNKILNRRPPGIFKKTCGREIKISDGPAVGSN